MLALVLEGLMQPPQMSSNMASSFGLLLALSVGPLPALSEQTISAYLVLQLIWCLLLWVRAVRTVGSQSVRRELEGTARAAWLQWMDVLRFSAVEYVCHHMLHFEVGAQACLLYCGTVALRAVAKPLLYAVLRVCIGAQWASKVTGYDPAALLRSIKWTDSTVAASGPSWKQYAQASGTGSKPTSAQTRVTSLAPVQDAGTEKNNNDRCTVLSEGPHFNRTARGCLLSF
ncbi:hypothetical protein NESM_000565200 [Novymonas esmeraldas]|uniref:Uncharacterized protein n=1 Tax=Novymonas esmeraldas TaxID=1808958 RepID=A0AAW0ERL7_9TRYP